MSTRAASATASLRAKQNLIRILYGTTTANRNCGVASNCHSGSNHHHWNTITNTTNGSSTMKQQSPYNTHKIDDDHSKYSYMELRKTYLQRIQQLHPDKYFHHHNNTTSINVSNESSKCSSYQRTMNRTSNVDDDDNNIQSISSKNQILFVQVQEAWKNYELYAKTSLLQQPTTTCSRHHDNVPTTTTNDDPNFILFGVGCSFADNEQERNYRIQIMDQASRGYFTCGEIGTTTTGSVLSQHNTKFQSNHDTCHHDSTNITTTTTTPSFTSASTSLLHDDIFDISNSNNSTWTTTTTNDSYNNTNVKRHSLVSHLIPPHRRHRPPNHI